VNVSGIISDEVRHLDDMTHEISVLDPDRETNIAYFLDQEQILFERFLLNLERNFSK